MLIKISIWISLASCVIGAAIPTFNLVFSTEAQQQCFEAALPGIKNCTLHLEHIEPGTSELDTCRAFETLYAPCVARSLSVKCNVTEAKNVFVQVIHETMEDLDVLCLESVPTLATWIIIAAIAIIALVALTFAGVLIYTKIKTKPSNKPVVVDELELERVATSEDDQQVTQELSG